MKHVFGTLFVIMSEKRIKTTKRYEFQKFFRQECIPITQLSTVIKLSYFFMQIRHIFQKCMCKNLLYIIIYIKIITKYVHCDQ